MKEFGILNLILMVICIVTPFFTEMYTTLFTPKYCLFPSHFLLCMPLTSSTFISSQMDIFMIGLILWSYRSHIHWCFRLTFSTREASYQLACNFLSKMDVGISLFCCSCGDLLVYNKCINNGCIHQEPHQVLPCLVSKTSNNILHSQLIMPIHTIHVLVVQMHIFRLIHMQFHGLFYDLPDKQLLVFNLCSTATPACCPAILLQQG